MDSKTEKQIEVAFTYHAPKEGQAAMYETLRVAAKTLAFCIAELCPEGRERSLALTKLEESVMWANAAIARHDMEG